MVVVLPAPLGPYEAVAQARFDLEIKGVDSDDVIIPFLQ